MPPDIRKSTALFEDRNSIGMTIGMENLWNILTEENRRAGDKPVQYHCVRRERLATDRLSLGTAMERYVYQNTITSISSLTLHINYLHCGDQGVNNVEGEPSVVTVRVTNFVSRRCSTAHSDTRVTTIRKCRSARL
jgi:predicted ATPase